MDSNFAEKESGFNIKEFILYTIKKWYISLAIVFSALVVGVIVAAITAAPQKVVRYQVVLRVEEFIVYHRILEDEFNEAGIDSDTALALYLLEVDSAVNAMRMLSSNIDDFLRYEHSRALVVNLTAQRPRYYLRDNLRIIADRFSVAIVYEREDVASTNSGYVHALLNAFAVFLSERAYEAVPSFYRMSTHSTNAAPAIVITPSRQVGIVEYVVEPVRHFLQGLGIGFLIGVVVALVAMLILYLLDPKIKSLGALEDMGLCILEKLEGDGSLEGASLQNLIAAAQKSKTLLITDVNGTCIDAAANKLAKLYTDYGYSVLIIDATRIGGNLKQVLENPEQIDNTDRSIFVEADAPAATAITLIFSSSLDWLSFYKCKANYDAIKSKYDKVLIKTPNASGALKFCAQLTEQSVCIIDIKIANAKQVRLYAESIAMQQGAEQLGAVVTNA